MIIIALVGFWALIRGQITLSPKWKLMGLQSGIYGGLLLVVALTPVGFFFQNLMVHALAPLNSNKIVLMAGGAVLFFLLLDSQF